MAADVKVVEFEAISPADLQTKMVAWLGQNAGPWDIVQVMEASAGSARGAFGSSRPTTKVSNVNSANRLQVQYRVVILFFKKA